MQQPTFPCGILVAVCSSQSYRAACRHVGGIRLLAWTLQNASAHSEFQELAALTAGRLVRGSPANQDAFLRAGGLEALQGLLGADWGETRRSAGVQAAAARALADVMAGNEAAKDALVRQGEFRPSLYALVQNRAAGRSVQLKPSPVPFFTAHTVDAGAQPVASPVFCQELLIICLLIPAFDD